MATKKQMAEYNAWLSDIGCPDNGYNFFRFRHGFTPYHVAKLLGISQTTSARYGQAESLPDSVRVLFLTLNKLDDMNACGSSNVSSLDLF